MASSYFEVKLSPKRIEKKEEVPVLVLAPFNKSPRVIFTNVNVGLTISRHLLIRNPTNIGVEVELLKLPAPERRLTFSTSRFLLQPHEEHCLEIRWNPTEEGSWHSVVIVKTNYEMKTEFGIIYSSVKKKLVQKKRRTMWTDIKSTSTITKGKSPKLCTDVTRSREMTTTSQVWRSTYSTCENKVQRVRQCSPKTPDIRRETFIVSLNNRNEVNTTLENTSLVTPPPKVVPSGMCTIGKRKQEKYLYEEDKFTVENAFRTLNFSPYVPEEPCKNIPTITFKSELDEPNDPSSCYLSPPLRKTTFSVFSHYNEVESTPLVSSNTNLESKVEPLNSESFSDMLSETTSINSSGGTYVVTKSPTVLSPDTLLQTGETVFNNSIHEMTHDFGLSNCNFSPLILPNAERLGHTHEPPMKRRTLSNIQESPDDLNLSTKTKLQDTFSSPPACIRKTVLDASLCSTTDDCRDAIGFDFLPHVKSMKDNAHFHGTDFADKETMNFNSNLSSPRKSLREISHYANVDSPFGAGYLPTSVSMFTSMQACNDTQKYDPTDFESKLSNICFDISPLKCGKENVQCSEKKISNLRRKLSHRIPEKITFSESPRDDSSVDTTCPMNVLLEISPPQIKSISNKLKLSRPVSKIPHSSKNRCVSLQKSQQLLTSASKGFQRTQPSKLKKGIARRILKLSLKPVEGFSSEKSVKLHDSEKFLSDITNPKYSLATAVVNPFLTNSIYYDQEWFDSREKEFVKWLNYLLTPHEHLSSTEVLPKVDVTDIWDKCCKQDVGPAPSRESVSSKYHVNHRLESLHKAACALFQLPSVAVVLSKVKVQIDKKLLSVRSDRNLHLDVGLKQSFVMLLLCYNPLWLRIGLETLYGRTIPLQSNSDVIGLVAFIVKYVLSDPYLVQRYSHPNVLNSFKKEFHEEMKKFVLKKFLFLVYFLDYAKENKLIGHDPCLFCKDADYKESHDILTAFAREFLSGMGDITRHLRSIGYTVKHKQTYLHEYDYAVTSLGTDLRDGVRLTHVMEIILQQSNLLLKLRTPAISKLQKCYNVGVALNALKNAGYAIEGNITSKDIVEGHKEKTLSLLWQIIYKFQAPHFNAAANKIQAWWHKNSLKVKINQRIRLRKELEAKYLLETKACILIQRQWRRYKAQKQCHQKRREIQLKCRQKHAVIIQNWFRATCLAKQQRQIYLNQQSAALTIQQWFRATHIAQKGREYFIKQRTAALTIQRWFRSIHVAWQEREYFVKQKAAALTIQRWIRTTHQTQKERENFMRQRTAVVIIQQWFRANQAEKEREYFIKQMLAALTIQQWFRATRQAKKEREYFIKQRTAIVIIQQWFRATRQAKKEREYFNKQRAAALAIQRWFRATHLAQKEREYFIKRRTATLIIQRWFRATHIAQKGREYLIQQKAAALTIQRWFIGTRQARKEREYFIKQRTAIVIIQRWFRTICLVKQEREHFLKQRKAASIIQQWYKLKHLAYIRRTDAATKIQALWRGYYIRAHVNTGVSCVGKTRRRMNEDDTLSNMYRSSIVNLRPDSCSGAILLSLQVLDTVTRLSRELSEEFSSSEHLETLLLIIQISNRSVSARMCLEVATSVIVNLMKHEKSAEHVSQLNTVPSLVRLMSIWCGKDSTVFLNSCTALWFLANDLQNAAAFRNENLVKSLQKMHNELKKKQVCESNMQRKSHTLQLHKIKHELPDTLPEWKLKKRNRPRVFQNALFAISSLLKRLPDEQ